MRVGAERAFRGRRRVGIYRARSPCPLLSRGTKDAVPISVGGSLPDAVTDSTTDANHEATEGSFQSGAERCT